MMRSNAVGRFRFPFSHCDTFNPHSALRCGVDEALQLKGLQLEVLLMLQNLGLRRHASVRLLCSTELALHTYHQINQTR